MVAFELPQAGPVDLEVFDVRGHRVSLVTREEVGAGNHVASWGGLNDRGEALASGVYFARLEAGGVASTSTRTETKEPSSTATHTSLG